MAARSQLLLQSINVIFFYLILLVAFYASQSVHAFEIPLPGGRRIKVEEGGILRIQLNNVASLPKAPEPGTLPDSKTINSIQVRDTTTVKGYGAYCTSPIAKSTFLGFYEGITFSAREQLEESLKTRNLSMDYVVSVDGGSTFIDGFDRAQDRKTFSPVHLNHADKDTPGCNCLRVLSSGQVAFFAARDIDSGEELCFDYGENYWIGRENEKL